MMSQRLIDNNEMRVMALTLQLKQKKEAKDSGKQEEIEQTELRQLSVLC